MSRSKRTKTQKKETQAESAPASKAVVAIVNDKIQKADKKIAAENKELGEKLEGMKADLDYAGQVIASQAKIGRQISQDAVAATAGHVTFEGINVFIRWLAENSKEEKGTAGWTYRNVDWLQSIPGGIGAIIYALNSYLLHSDEKAHGHVGLMKVPPSWRITLNKSANLMANLGLSNTFRALRYRWAENIDEIRIKDEVVAGQKEENAKLRAELQALKEQLEKLVAEKK